LTGAAIIIINKSQSLLSGPSKAAAGGKHMTSQRIPIAGQVAILLLVMVLLTMVAFLST